MHQDIAAQRFNRPREATEWLAFIEDPEALAVFVDFAKHQNKISECFHPHSLSLMHDWIKSGIMPDFIFIEISGMEPPYTQLQNLLEELPGSAQIIVLGNENDIGRYRKLQRLGISEYLFFPITEELLMQACLEPGMKRIAPGQKMKTLIPVIGVRGGVGATTLAINSAYCWSQLPNQRVCLVDFDTQASDVALNLDITEHEGLQEAITETERIDFIFINSLLIESNPNFFVIPNKWSLAQPYDDSEVTEASLQHFLMLLYEKADTIFLDLSYPLNKNLARMLLPHAHCCLLVTDLSLSATRDTTQLIHWLKIHAPEAAIKVIANSTRPQTNIDLMQNGLEQALGKKLDLILPYSKNDVQQSILNGSIYAQKLPKSPFSKKLRAFIQLLAQEQKGIQPARKSWWQRLRGWL